MADMKKPFHEVLSTELDIAVLEVLRNLGTEKEVKFILEVLFAGKMPASAAHQIAEYYAGLPSLLSKAGWNNLSKFAEEVLADLRNREDEKKQEGEPLGIVIGRALSNLTPEK